MDLTAIASAAVAAIVLVGVALVVFGFAVWFGRRVLAPRIGRALDRPEPEDEPVGDRHH